LSYFIFSLLAEEYSRDDRSLQCPYTLFGYVLPWQKYLKYLTSPRQIYMIKGWSLLRLNRYEEALNSLDIALKQKKAVRLGLAHVFFGKGVALSSLN
jgi:hypothetical protein